MESTPKFLCVSVNPAIDKRARATRLRLGGVNRVHDVVPEPGGKAAHVALALRALGEAPLWIGFAGGPSGDALIAGLNAEGIRTQSVNVQAPTRVNLAILDEAGEVTEVLEPGGSISNGELSLFLDSCKSAFVEAARDAQVIFSGSLPPGVPQDFYAQLVRAAHAAGCRTFLDTSGTPLALGLEGRPDIAKPNREEAEFLTGKSIVDLNDAKSALQEIFTRGTGGVGLSLGRDGLLWCASANASAHLARAPFIEARSAVGSGDATLAGLAQSISRGLAPDETARFAAACGAANCLAESPGKISPKDVQDLMKATTVETLP